MKSPRFRKKIEERTNLQPKNKQRKYKRGPRGSYSSATRIWFPNLTDTHILNATKTIVSLSQVQQKQENSDPIERLPVDEAPKPRNSKMKLESLKTTKGE